MIDLSVGEPTHLQSFLREVAPSHIGRSNPFSGASSHGLDYYIEQLGSGYPRPGGESDLCQAIYDFEKVRNHDTSNVPKRVIVTNGAIQGLGAALYAVTERGRYGAVQTEAPYWSELPGIVHGLGLGLFHESEEGRPRLGVVPNNPCGSQLFGCDPVDVWDAAYADPVYGWNGIAPEHRIKVVSASKLFGCSHMRVGWILVPSALADMAIEYVQRTTAGVSRIAQAYLLGLLNNYSCRYREPEVLVAREKARNVLLHNRMVVDAYLSSCADDHTAQDEVGPVGMFAWLKPFDLDRFVSACSNANVVLAPGGAFGSVGHLRMNLGAPSELVEIACADIRKEYWR